MNIGRHPLPDKTPEFWVAPGWKGAEVPSIKLKLRVQAGNTSTKKYLYDNSVRPAKKYIFIPSGSLAGKDPKFGNSVNEDVKLQFSWVGAFAEALST